MSKEAKLIEATNPREAIRKHQETANWPYRAEAAFWYAISQDMDRQFFNGLIYPDGRRVPSPFIAFDDLEDQRTIASYDLFPDGLAIIGKITFNTAHYIDREDKPGHVVKEWEFGRYSQGETLLHEYVHLWQQIGRGVDPYSFEKHRKETHNKEWLEKARSFGLNPQGPAGVHTRIATPDSPIDKFLKERGIYPPKAAFSIPADNKINWAFYLTYKDKPRPKSKSTIHKEHCPNCGEKRYATKKEPRPIYCGPCTDELGVRVVYVKDDGKSHTIYKAK